MFMLLLYWKHRLPGASLRPKETIMAETEARAEHTLEEHAHGENCGHESVQHDEHVDYIHDGHKHALHEDHYDEH